MSPRSYPCLLTIYLLRNNVDEEIYAGSTTNLKKRMGYHKSDAKKACKKDRKLYEHINKIGWGHFYAESLYEFYCKDAEYADQSEEIAVECFGSLNTRKAHHTPEEAKAYKKAYYKAYGKAYESREEVKARRKAYNSLPKRKASRKAHQASPKGKQTRREGAKRYRSDPKRGGKPITCPCSQNTIKKYSYGKHCRSKKHRRYLESVAV